MSALRAEATDEMLMVSYQRGDREAFGELLNRYHKPIYNFCLLQLKDGKLAERVTHEIFACVVRQASRFKHESRFCTWLYSIARSLILTELSRPQPGKEAPSRPGAFESESSLPLRDADAKIDGGPDERDFAVATRIVGVVNRLPADQREVFLLRELAQLPLADIGTITGTDRQTVTTLMRHALDRLQQALCNSEEFARALR